MASTTEFMTQYTLMTPTLDLKHARATLQQGLLSKAVGLDGRSLGAGKRFCGLRLFKDLGLTATSVWFFKYVTMQWPTETSYNNIRGFVVGYTSDADGSKCKLFYWADGTYVDSPIDLWPNETLTAADAETIDVTTHGTCLYCVKAGASPVVVYRTYGGVATLAVMGVPTAYVPQAGGPLIAPALSPQVGGGVLSAGKMLVAFRYVNVERNLKSSMSLIAEATVGAGGYVKVDGATVAGLGTGESLTDTWTHIEIYRSISDNTAASITNKGLLYKVTRITCPDKVNGDTTPWTYDLGRTTTDALRDSQVVVLDKYDEEKYHALPIQTTLRRIISVDGTTFAAGTTSTYSPPTLNWSPPDEYLPEVLPALNSYRLKSEDGEVVEFINMGEYVLAFCEGGFYRIQLQGTIPIISRVASCLSPTSRWAVSPVNGEVLMVAPSGVILLSDNGTKLVQVTALDDLINDPSRWRGTLDHVSIAPDAALGAVFLLNSDQEEAVVIWQATNMVTELEDMNFALMTSGVDAAAPAGGVRAYFVDAQGRIYVPDAEGTNSVKTLRGVGGTVNGVPGADSGVNALLPVYAADYTGCKLHIIRDSDGSETVHDIIECPTNEIHFSPDLTYAPFEDGAATCRYSVSPIPVRLRLWPLGGQDDVGYPRYLFKRWLTYAMSINSCPLTGTGVDGTHDVWRLGLCRNLEAVPSVLVEGDMDVNPADSYYPLNVDGTVLEPYIEQLASDLSFTLNALQIDGKFSSSRKTS